MNKRYLYLSTALLFLTASIIVGAAMKDKKNKFDELVVINTSFGEITLVLYDDTPLHKANFIALADSGYYDSTTFHRIIKDFMIQGGDPNSKDDDPTNDGFGGPGYRIPAEFKDHHIHKFGALAAARMGGRGNPMKESSGSQFYIVKGKKVSQAEIDQMQQMKGRVYTPEQVSIYDSIGGTPFLDGDYTVFGEVIDGFALIDSVLAQPIGSQDRPQSSIPVTMKVEKMKRKKVTKKYGYVYPVLPTTKEP